MAQHDHDGHGANPIFFNKTNKDWTSRTLTTPHPLRPITSHFSFTPPPNLQSGRHMCITLKDNYSDVCKRHLGALIGTEENKKNYTNDKIREWTKEINVSADIATTHPQAAYTAYVTSYRHKLTYLLRTIPNIEDQLKKIDEVVRHNLIPAIIGGHIINR